MKARCALALALACVAPSYAAAQASQLGAPKHTRLPSVLRPACSITSNAPTAPSEAVRQRARAAAAGAQQAAILGDAATALARLQSARTLDPTDADVAYQLARVYESAGAADSATKEYCRFLTLSPNATDAEDARARLAVLARPTPDPATETANANFEAGISAYNARHLVDAEGLFTKALETHPTWADAYFNRALARLAQGDREQAANDLELYLRIDASAPDRTAVAAQLDALRRPQLSRAQALSVGLLVPGAGQFYTRRPVRGVLFLAAAGGAVAYGLAPQQSTTTTQETANDPFGNPYTYSVTRRESSRPNLVPGIAAAGAIAIIGAIEASLYANRANNAVQRVSLTILPTHGVLAARISF